MENKLSQLEYMMQQLKGLSGNNPRETALDDQGLGYIGRPVEQIGEQVPTPPMEPSSELETNPYQDIIDGTNKSTSEYFKRVGEGSLPMPGVGLGINNDLTDIEGYNQAKDLNTPIVNAPAELKDLANNPDSTPEETRQQLMDEYRKLTNRQIEDLNNAAEMDRKSQLYQSLGESLGKALTYSATAGGKYMSAPIPLQFTKIDPKYLEQAKLVNNARENEMLARISNQQLTEKQKIELLKAAKEGTLTPYQKAQLALDENRFKLSEERDKRREEKDQGYKRVQLLTNATNLLSKDPTYKDNVEQNKALNDVYALVNQAQSGNPTALSQLGAKMAKAMGEKGALTTSDVTRYIEAKPWGEKFMSYVTAGGTGKLTHEVEKGLKDSVGELGRLITVDINKTYKNVFGRLKSTYKDSFTDDDIYGAIGIQPADIQDDLENNSKQSNPNSTPSASPNPVSPTQKPVINTKPKYTEAQQSSIDKFMKINPGVSETEAFEYLKGQANGRK